MPHGFFPVSPSVAKNQQQQNILWEWGDVLIIFKQIRLGTVSLIIKVDSICIAGWGVFQFFY